MTDEYSGVNKVYSICVFEKNVVHAFIFIFSEQNVKVTFIYLINVNDLLRSNLFIV